MGTTEPGATVTITWPDNSTTTVVADASGNWSSEATAPEQGVVTAVATDSGGNTGSDVDQVDTLAKTTIVINDAATVGTTDEYINAADMTAASPIRTVSGSVMSGGIQTVEAGQTVTVTLKDAAGHTVTATATVLADGTWTTPQMSFSGLDEGTITATATVTDITGNTASATDTTVKDTVVNATLAFSNLTNWDFLNSSGSDAAILTKDNVYDLTVTSTETSYTVNKYEVSTDGGLTWTTTTSAQNLASTPNQPYVFRALVTDAAGNSGYTNTVSMVLDTVAPATPTATMGSDLKTITGTAEPGSQVWIDVNDDGTKDYSTTAAVDGSYTVVLPSSVVIFTDVAVMAVDAAGNTSANAYVGYTYNTYTQPNQYAYVLVGSTYVKQTQQVGSKGSDTITIGLDPKGQWTTLTQGNIWNEASVSNPDYVLNLTEGGNDTVTITNGGDIMQDTQVWFGSGDDKLIMNNSAGGATQDIVGTDPNPVEIKLGEGNNLIDQNGAIYDAVITAGSGADVVKVTGNISGLATSISLGDGADTLTVGGGVSLGAQIDMGAGDDTVSVGSISNSGLITQKPIDGAVELAGGAGTDTLKITGAGVTFNLVDTSSFEHIDINGSGANVLRVGYNTDVQTAMGDNNPLYITGGADDTVDLGDLSATNSKDLNQDNLLGDLLGGTMWAKTGATTTWTDAVGVTHTFNAWQYGTDSAHLVYIETTITKV